MTPFPLNLPPGSECANFLYSGSGPEDLTQDMLTIALPSGLVIDVGWFPEHDLQGQFSINVFRETPDEQLLERPIVTKNIGDVVYFAEKLAWHYSAPLGYSSRATVEVIAPSAPTGISFTASTGATLSHGR